MEISQDRRDRLEGLVLQVSVVLLEQPVPADQQDLTVRLETWDQMDHRDLKDFKVELVIEDNQDYLDLLDHLVISVQWEDLDLQVMFICECIFFFSLLKSLHGVIFRRRVYRASHNQYYHLTTAVTIIC